MRAAERDTHNTSRIQERFWKVNKIQFVYDTSQAYFKDAINPGKHTAVSHHLTLFRTPEGKSYKCKAQETLVLISSDHHKMVSLFLSQTHIQPFDINSDFIFSEASKCVVDQQERLEETLPLILGLTLGLIIVVMLTVYHLHQKYTATARQTQVPRDRAQYKHM
ncbi:lysosome-associated membrane glycoprotein 5 [Callorhinchus milii]|uniref:lysosome-associated membrane glycoprotein 5 n=1 Tax=Callorhinchus milii TaxID=7868 RepID=UPI001C3FC128|nr:lysosome-associated membrane glycoprotein 5 [Callorhinchus milii]